MATNPSRRKPLLLLLGVVAAALVIAVLTTSGNDDDPAPSPYGEVTIAGDALPPLTDPDADPAIGTPAPTATGTTTTGEVASVVGAGEPTLVLFLAHWCPHCRAEVPVVVQWLADGRLPDGVTIVAVATATDPGQANYPPQPWLAGEQWPATIILDDEDDTIAAAFGVSGFPFWVVLDADGNVTARLSGELTPEQLDALAGMALA